MKIRNIFTILIVFSIMSCIGMDKKFPVDKVICDQPMLSIDADSSEQAVLRIRVYSPQNFANVSALKVVTNGTEDLRSIGKIAVYFTEKSDKFDTSVQFGRYENPMDVVTFKGNVNLKKGVNYFWVTYTLSDTAKPDTYVDAACTEIVVLEKLYQVNKVSDPHKILIK
ncbi:MAG: hypothetical protein JXR63_00305 [Spirochaetales bacterium]|nr:hypothetical protein [Spirochaetales bacterium]